MTPPVLLAIDPTVLTAAAGSALPEGARAFAIRAAGSFAGRTWEEGDVLLVGGRPGWGHPLVMVPRGKGRPSVGRRDRHGLQGGYGETCSCERWAVAGRILATWRAAEGRLELHADPSAPAPASPVPAPIVEARPQTRPAPPEPRRRSRRRRRRRTALAARRPARREAPAAGQPTVAPARHGAPRADETPQLSLFCAA